jgi:hypothetical protein
VVADLTSLLERFVRACLDVFGEDRVEGIVLHGSAHKGGSIPGFSDIDFMVFLAQACFDEHQQLPDELVFAIQERIGPLPWREAGFLYPQAYFYDARRLPEWWTGPAPGAYRELWGRLPPEAASTAEGLRTSSTRFLKETLSDYIARDLAGFIDANNDTLPRRVRLLGTAVTPTVFALTAYDAEDALEVWAQPKFEALRRLKERYGEAEGPALAQRFYDNVRLLYADEFDADLARQTFRIGIEFLRWAEQIGETLPPDAASVARR